MKETHIGLGLPERSWSDTVAAVQHAESLGFDFICMGDHPSFKAVDCPIGFAALAALTTRIKLLSNVIAVPFRPPSILAKTMASLDVVSNGRLILGLGTGWHEEDFHSYGIPFESKRVRDKGLIEAIQIIRAMWTQERATFEGETWSIHEALCEPKPVQKPYPPIWVGSHGGLRALREVIAPYADGWNIGVPTFPDAPPIETTIDTFRAMCESIGRDPREVTISINLPILGTSLGDRPGERLPSQHLSGYKQRFEEWKILRMAEPQKIVDQIGRLSDLGVSYFMFAVFTTNLTDDLAALADRVLPTPA